MERVPVLPAMVVMGLARVVERAVKAKRREALLLPATSPRAGAARRGQIAAGRGSALVE